MIPHITTKPPNEEAFSASDHDKKSNEKDTRTDSESKLELGSFAKKYSHSILERIERDEKPCEKTIPQTHFRQCTPLHSEDTSRFKLI